MGVVITAGVMGNISSCHLPLLHRHHQHPHHHHHHHHHHDHCAPDPMRLAVVATIISIIIIVNLIPTLGLRFSFSFIVCSCHLRRTNRFRPSDATKLSLACLYYAGSRLPDTQRQSFRASGVQATPRRTKKLHHELYRTDRSGRKLSVPSPPGCKRRALNLPKPRL